MQARLSLKRFRLGKVRSLLWIQNQVDSLLDVIQMRYGGTIANPSFRTFHICL